MLLSSAQGSKEHSKQVIYTSRDGEVKLYSESSSTDTIHDIRYHTELPAWFICISNEHSMQIIDTGRVIVRGLAVRIAVEPSLLDFSGIRSKIWQQNWKGLRCRHNSFLVITSVLRYLRHATLRSPQLTAAKETSSFATDHFIIEGVGQMRKKKILPGFFRETKSCTTKRDKKNTVSLILLTGQWFPLPLAKYRCKQWLKW